MTKSKKWKHQHKWDTGIRFGKTYKFCLCGARELDDFTIVVAPIPTSIAHYDWRTNTIHLWGWKEDSEWYRFNGESPFSQIVRTIAHEDMHRILYALIGFTSAWNYDFITKLNLDDLP